MKILRFFFPIAFALSKNGKQLTWGIIIHSALTLLYFSISTIAFFVSIPLWIALFLVPILSVIFMLAFVALLFILLVLGIIVPFYCIGGILLGILNYKKILSVLEDTEEKRSEEYADRSEESTDENEEQTEDRADDTSAVESAIINQ